MDLSWFQHFGAALTVYVVGTAMPGPGNLSIAHASLNHGRAPGLSMAAGVVSGSLCWGAIAAAGVSAVLVSNARLFVALKILGASYLLWLAYKAVASALSDAPVQARATAGGGGLGRFFLQGLGIHLTNPKAILTWLTVTALGLSAGAPAWAGPALVAMCGLLGFAVFMGYALAFSSRAAGPFFARTRKPFGLLCAAFYAFLALGFLNSLR